MHPKTSNINANKRKKRQAFFWGLQAENRAAWYLRCKGYKIKYRRFKTYLGEIDLIAQKKNVVLIVEVKARKTVEEALRSLSLDSEKRLERAADLWLSTQKDHWKLSLRFDLIVIQKRKLPTHLPDYFRAKL